MAEIQVDPGIGTLARASASAPNGTVFVCQPGGVYLIDKAWRPKEGQVFVARGGLAIVKPTSGYAATAEPVGFECKERRGVRIDGFEVTAFHWGVRPGPAGYVAHVDAHHNRRTGIGAGFSGVAAGTVVEDCEVHENGTPSQLGKGSGGIKFANTGQTSKSGVTVRRVNAWANLGVGIWFDIDCAYDAVEDCHAIGNTRKGIFYEISHGPARFVRNTATGNGKDQPRAGGGIVVVSSQRVEVAENTLGNNVGAGIRIRRDSRGYAFSDVYVHDNDMNGDKVVGCGQSGVRCERNA